MADTDTDSDGTPDCTDNCPSTPNADQADLNTNGIGDACEDLALRLETIAAVFNATGVGVRVFVEADESQCTSRASLRMTFDGTDLDFTSIEAAANCAGTLTPIADGVADIEITCNPGFPGEGVIATLRVSTPAAGTETRYALVTSLAEAEDCEVPSNTLAPASADGAVLVGCILGDVFRGTGSLGTITTADFIVSRRMALGTTPETVIDQACGDVHPAAITCQKPPGQQSHLCIVGDADIRSGDVIVLRRRLNLLYTFQCAACTTQLARHAGLRRAGDIAPGPGDGQVGIADAVRALRLSVGLDEADAETLLRGDVAPASRESDGLLAVAGDGRVGVADAVLLLRAAVELERLAWPEREVAVVLDGEAPAVAWRAQVSGWPEWAESSSFEGPGCDDMSGLDSAGSTWASVCALPAEAPGPHAATWRYRAATAIDPASLRAEGEAVDEALNATLLPVVLIAP